MTAVRQLADRFLTELATLNPAFATFVGLDIRQDEMPDMSPEGEAAQAELAAATLRELGGRLAYVLEFRLPPRSRGEVVGEVIVDARSGSVISVHRAGGRAAR